MTKTLSQSTVLLNISAPIDFAILKVANCVIVKHVWRENRVRGSETRITSEQDMEKGRVALAQVFVLDRHGMAEKSTNVLFALSQACIFAYAIPIQYFNPESNE